MKLILPYFLLAVMAVLLFQLWQSNRELKRLNAEANSRIQEVIEAKQAEILKFDTLVATIREKMRKDSLKDLPVITGLKLKARTLRIKLAELGEVTPQEVADTTCERLIRVSQLKDSVIEKQDDLISTLELRHSATLIDLNAIIRAQSSQLLAQLAIADAKDQQLASETKEHRKTKRRSTFKSIGLGILTGGIIYLSLKE